MTRWRNVVAAAIAAALAGLAVAGCGVGGQRHASVIPSRDVPSVLLQPPQTPTPTPTAEATSTIYLVHDDGHQTGLVPIQRPRSETPTLQALLARLLKGPTDAEAAQGLTTAINTGPSLIKVVVFDGVATVDLTEDFGTIRGQEQVLATAQIVMTATSFPGVSAVQISLAGTLTAVPLADGTLTTQPLTRSEYAGLLAPASAPAQPAARTLPPSSAGASGP